ncbi:MAG TPA: hypothetical protein VHV51_11385 [Polyangiaceae bacterium]|jgi:hypothetical protein|nr:hypothetical protein [Polyangiaceae bacterium]
MKNTSLRLVGATAAAILDQATATLRSGDSRFLREPTGIHMALRAARLPDHPAGSMFSVGHYHQCRAGAERGFLADPEVVLLRLTSSEWLPLSIRTPFAHVVTLDTSDTPRLLDSTEHIRLARFVDAWMVSVVQARLLPSSDPVSERAKMWSPSSCAAE